MNKRQTLKDALAKGYTEKVNEILEELTQNQPTFNNDVVLLSARFEQYRQKKNKGVLSDDKLTIEINQIHDSLLDIINQLPQSVFEMTNKSEELKKISVLSNTENETLDNTDNLKGLVRRLYDTVKDKDKETPIPVQKVLPHNPTPQEDILKILFLGANPFNTGKLNLQAEYTEIAKRLEDGVIKEKVRLQSEFSTTIEDFQIKSEKFKPNIIHFAGHGKDENKEMTQFAQSIGLTDWRNDAGLVFFDRNHVKHIYIKGKDLEYNLKGLIEIDKIPIKIIIFNACYSVNQAKIIAKHVKYVIGVHNKIMDDASIDFTAGFYRVLVEGKDVETAFVKGKGLAISKLENKNQIVLFIDGVKTKL